MPYKHKNIEYGLPHEEYPKKRVCNNLDVLGDVLELKNKPVGVKLLFTEDEYLKFCAPEPKAKIPYCVMVKNAAISSKPVKCRLEHNACDGATTALALEKSTEKIESGREYFSYKLYSSVAAARRMRETIQSLHRLNVATYGVGIMPLEDFDEAPDVVILITNSFQTMRFVQGYSYQLGKKPKVDIGAMQAMCSELTVVPYLTGDLNVSVMCPSTRMLCKWSENDMAIGMPFELLDQIVQGVVATQMQY